MNIIKYSKPAKSWREALPLANGKTGLMIYGSLKKEKICFNDGTLWSGYPKDYNSSESLENLEKVRSLIFEGRNDEADALCEEKLTGFYSETFLPLGEVTIDFKGLDKNKYSRSLNLSKGVHTVLSMGAKSVCFSSFPDKISVYKITSAKPFNAVIGAKSKLKSKAVSENGSLFLLGNAPDYATPNYLRTELYPIRYNEKKGMAFCLQTLIKSNGKITQNKASFKIENASELTLYFVTKTGFNGFDKMPETSTNKVKQNCMAKMSTVDKDFELLKSRHIKDFSALFNKQSISFDCDKEVDASDLLKSVKAGGDEKALCELMYNYGKYMIISGSRKGSQPLNLQGIWNDSNSRVSVEHSDESKRDVPLTKTVPDNWNDYDTVFLGYPIWWGSAAWPVNNFVKGNDFSGKTVIPFCTSASSGIGQSDKDLAKMAGTGNWKDGERFSSDTSSSKVETWVKGLKK